MRGSASVFGLALLVSAAVSPPALADGDAAKGETVFKKCLACHRIGEGAKNLIGPNLTGVIGRQAGTIEGFAYSPLTKAAGQNGLVWNEDLVFNYLADPNTFMKSYLTEKGKADQAAGASKMVFKLPSEAERKDVIAYLKTFSAKK